MKGFFSPSELIVRETVPLLPRCGECGLYKHCHSPKMPVDGKGKKEILIVGEAPGRNEDNQGIPFIGESGELLQRTLQKLDVNLREDCWITNAAICRPQDLKGGNRTPTNYEIAHCRPNVVRAIKELKPKVVILLGASAVKSVIGWLWKEDVGLVSRWDGWQIPSQKINAWVCPTWHPAAILRSDYGSGKGNEVRGLFFERHLEAACKLQKRPWREVPQWEKQIRPILNCKEAVQAILEFISGEWPIAFDYETDRLKPDHPDVRIVSCSVSDGEKTIAYPWHGAAIEATQQLLRSPLPKIASNMKFEERWTYREFGHGVRNWKLDTMLAAHVLDNRGSITSIKFQGFVLLGQDAWDGKVKPFLEAKGGNTPNRIREVDLTTLLIYNGMDSLIEYKVAEIQEKQLGVQL